MRQLLLPWNKIRLVDSLHEASVLVDDGLIEATLLAVPYGCNELNHRPWPWCSSPAEQI